MGDTVRVPRIDSIAGVGDSVTVGRPTVIIRTGRSLASVWLARRRDTIELYAAIPDTTVDWSDDFVISLSLGSGGKRRGTRSSSGTSGGSWTAAWSTADATAAGRRLEETLIGDWDRNAPAAAGP